MIGIWFWAIFIALVLGLALKFGFGRLQAFNEYTGRDIQISWLEFAIVMAVLTVIVVPATTAIGFKLAKASKVTYHEFWGGYETAALQSTQECHRDGGCQDEYNCDPYEVPETIIDTDSKGNVTGSHVVYHTEYHDCPVATRENYWTIDTTLGKYNLGMTFDLHAVPWRSSHGLDGTPEGPPALWAAAKARIDAGDPGPVTADRTYSNYILASTRTILHKFSGAVDKYQKAKLLPDPVRNIKSPIYNHYYAIKMQFVGVHGGVSAAAWNFALGRLNAALGTDLQGDLHVVAVNARDTQTNPGVPRAAADEYAGALNAWWQDKRLERRALSKNGIGLVLGVDGDTISWARAFTGMPVGNAGLTLDLQNSLKGQPFTAAIFGHPTGVIGKDGKVTVQHGDSPVEQALWGSNKFHRVCMLCKSKGDSGVGYGYLGGEIQPSGGQKLAIELISILFVLIGWACALAFGVGERSDDTQ